jgi:hypothetical protein
LLRLRDEKAKGQGFVTGHGFSRADHEQKTGAGFSGCGKTLIEAGFVTGHDFSRAAKGSKEGAGFSPCQGSCLR